MIITLLTVAIVSASLESTASSMNEVHIPSFLTINDARNALDVKHVMMNSVFEVGDLIGKLSELLDLPRESAIDHFIAKNIPELELVMVQVAEALKAPNDIVLASIIATGVLPPISLLPLQTLIRNYINGKYKMCLYDELPMGLRSYSAYQNMFSMVDPTAYRVKAGASEGLLVSLPDEHCPDDDFFLTCTEFKVITIHTRGDKQPRLISPGGECAVDLNDMYTEIRFFPLHRAVFAMLRGQNITHAWRGDSFDPLVIENVSTFVYPRGLLDLSKDKQYFLLRSQPNREDPFAPAYPYGYSLLPVDPHSKFEAKGRKDLPASHYQWLHYPLCFRGKSGTRHILSDAGHSAFRRIFESPIAVRRRVASLQSLDRTPFIYSLMRLQTQEFGNGFRLEDVLSQMDETEEIMTKPISRWWQLYLDMLDRMIGEF